MATIDGMKVNGSVDQVDRHHENRIFVVRRGLIMFQTLLALLLMGALLMAWPLGRAAAAPGSPEFKSFEKNDIVDDQHITIDKPEGTAEGDLLIGAVVHSDNEVTIDPPAGWSTIDLASCNNDQCTLGVFYLVAGESEPANYTFVFNDSGEAAGGILRYSGADPSDPINIWDTENGNSVSPTAPDVTTTVVGTTVVRIAAVDQNHFAIDNWFPDGHTGRFIAQADDDNGPTILGVADITQASAGATGAAAFTIISTEEWRTMTVAIKPVLDDPPVAVDDTATVAKDASATTIDVLSNDTDPDGGPISIASVTQPTNGAVVITNAGADLTYQPSAGYCNDGTPTDDFIYTLTPGGSTATVAVTVTCVDNPPVAVDDTATVAKDASATTIDVLSNDTDTDGGPISIASVTQPTNGAVVITNAGADLTYQPSAGYCNDGTPTDDFTYTLTPGGSTATVAVTVTCVDNPPVAVDDTATVAKDVSAATIDVLSNDTDTDGGPISIASVTQPTNGAVVITNAGADLTYQPSAGYCNDGTPTDDFTYTLTPGGSTATVAVTVTCVDNPPVAVDDTATVAKDVSAATIDVLSNDTDTDGGPISIASVTQPTNGAVVITNAGADLTYQPSAGYCNDSTPTDDFTYTLTPGGSTATVAVTVTCVDDPPFPDVPTLTVIKTVVNDDGGSALASDWTMDVSGTNVSGTGFAGSASSVTITLDAGAYSVSESGGPSGYAMSFSADCSGTISAGDVLTCTITNDDIAADVPTLTVIKTVVNDDGGSALASDWTMDISGTNVSGTGFAGSASGVTITLDAGAYSVSESGGPSGYAMFFSADCSGTISAGDVLTCTITNDDIAADVPTLTVIKTVVNDDGGSALASDWTMDISGTNVSGTGFAGSASGVTITLDAGAYSVSESGGPSGYAMFFSADCSGTISAGDVLTCTITNDDDQVVIAPANTPPTATITSPAFFATFLTTDGIAFNGSGNDTEDGNLVGASLVWTSSTDGLIGTGTSVTRSLSAGGHTITLTATDSDGAEGTAIRTISVNSVGGGGGGITPPPTPTPGPEPVGTPAPTPGPDVPGTGGGGGSGSTGGTVGTATPTPNPTPVVAEPTVTPTPTAMPVPAPDTTPVPEPTPEPPAPGATPVPAPQPEPSDGGGGGSALPAGGIAGIILAVVAAMAAAIYYDVRRGYRLDELNSV